MKRELELELVKKYPNLFRGYGGNIRNTCMGWGMSHFDGWYHIIDKIGRKLKEINVEDKVIATQVKEKFGGLRFYYYICGNLLSESESKEIEIEKIIEEAEDESYKTCEVCGNEGKLRGRGWIMTLCETCNNKEGE